MIELEELKQKLLRALENLKKEDNYLLLNDLNERTITHKLAEHLQKEFTNYNEECL